MTGMPLLWLILIFVATSAVSVVTGSTSLITVPAMLQFHIEPRAALATNMFALTFMSVGGAFPFLRGQGVNRKRLPLLISLTLAGSIIGAFLLLLIPTRSVPVIVSAAMIGIAIFSLVYRKSGMQDVSVIPSESAEFTGYALTFLLGIYGGFFSGGYVTILTAVYVTVFRLSFCGGYCNNEANERLFVSGSDDCVHVSRTRELPTRTHLGSGNVWRSRPRGAIRNSIGESLVETHFPDSSLGSRFESTGVRFPCKCLGVRPRTIAC
jgi:hypothetical protein